MAQEIMEEPGLIERIQNLTDLELALLLSLVADEHCLIHSEEEFIDPLEEELQLVRCDAPLLNASSAERLIDCFQCLWPLPCNGPMQQFYKLGGIQQWDPSKHGFQSATRKSRG